MRSLVCAAVALSALTNPVVADTPRDRMLVTAQWLHQHRDDPNLVLLHVGDRAEYDAGHIAGARYVSLRYIAKQDSELALQLADLPVLDSVFRSLGVTTRSRVVVYYGKDWISPTTRVWLTLDYMGLGDRVSLLDGGMGAWKAAGLPTTAELPGAVTPSSTSLVTRSRPQDVATVDWLSARLTDPRIAVLDARNPQFYRGLSPTDDPRPGHLPGARNLPYDTVVGDDLHFKSDSELRKLFADAGVTKGREVIAYCHIGQQATAVVFAARLIGLSSRLYDGSFQEWSARTDLAVEGAIPVTQGKLITTEALAARIGAGDVTVVDARGDLWAYFADHLPGSVFLHYETLRAAGNGIPADTLAAVDYASLLGRLGIRRDRPVVVYGTGDAGNFNATFLLWVLSGFRHPEVYLLDGGYTKWAAEGRQLTRKYPHIERVAYAVDPYLLDVADRSAVEHATGHGMMALVDVRPADQFNGQAGPQLRRGHIPSAIHHFWQDDLVAVNGTKVWKPVEQLRAAYTAQGITPDRWIIIYCNTGTEASHAYFALKHLLGYPRVQVYVPGWTEWSEEEELPITTAQAAGQ